MKYTLSDKPILFHFFLCFHLLKQEVLWNLIFIHIKVSPFSIVLFSPSFHHCLLFLFFHLYYPVSFYLFKLYYTEQTNNTYSYKYYRQCESMLLLNMIKVTFTPDRWTHQWCPTATGPEASDPLDPHSHLKLFYKDWLSCTFMNILHCS